MVHICESCSATFSTAFALRRHVAKSCEFREPASKRAKNENVPSSSGVSRNIRCRTCHCDVQSKKMSAHLKSNEHKSASWTPADGDFEIMESAFRNRIISYKVNSNATATLSVDTFMEDVKIKVMHLINSELKKHKLLKVNLELFGLYTLPSKEIAEVKSHNSGNKIIDLSSDLDSIYSEYCSIIDQKASEFLERDSGWILMRFIHLEVNINKYNPLRASSYIPLPREIVLKKAVINIKNCDQNCFGWSLTAAVCKPQGSASLVSSYPHFSSVFDYSDIEFPVELKSIECFEKKNNLSINVYGLEQIYEDGRSLWQVVGPLHYTKEKKSLHVNLLLLDDSMGNYHYCLIKDLSRLVSQQLSHHNGKKYICDGCLSYFNKKSLLEKHMESECNYIRVILPGTDKKIDDNGNLVSSNILKFANFNRQSRLPFVFYADFECLMQPFGNILNTTNHTERKYQHIPCSFSYYLKCSFDDSLSKVEFHRGLDAPQVFVSRLETDCRRIYNQYLKKVVPMKPLSLAEEEQFKNAGICYICEEPFSSEQPKQKVRDHCHLTGNFRGAAHMSCNLNYKIPLYLPIVIHNLKNYDTAQFLRELAADHGQIDIIPINFEKYISFTKRVEVDKVKINSGYEQNIILSMRFIDSFQFLSESLDTLSSTLEPHQFREIRKYFSEDAKFNYMKQKGVFPYSYVTNISKLAEPSLPEKAKFYNELKDEHISDEDYNRAKKIFEEFKCKTLGDYYDLYLLTDVLLLADVFENYRDVCEKFYKIDPAHYYTAPGVSWDAMLKYTKVELELLTDIDMLHFFQSGIRGGVSTCTTRKAEANNEFLQNHDPTKPTSYIMYLDATNLYGYAMQNPLPKGGFAWLTQSEISKMYNDITTLQDDDPVGYVFEVDLKYPDRLHSKHNDLPFAPENIIPPGAKQPKLIPNLCDKKKYIIHYTALKQCLEYGLELTKIHRGIRFDQSCWLKPYIDLNTRLRNAAKTKFENKLFKFKTNSIFGKTMENVEKRVNIKLATQFEKNGKRNGAENYIAKPNFKSRKIFDENLVAIHLNKLYINYNRPSYVGFSILDIAKTVIYNFFYGYLKQKYGENCLLLYTDTDSLVIQVFTPNFYSDMKNSLDKFDTSNYDSKNIHNVPVNTSVIGKMKDEFGGRVVSQFLGTGSKAYCLQVENDVFKKAKGVKQSSVQKQLNIEHYSSVVNGSASHVTCTMYVFRSDHHRIYTDYLRKVALSSKDDKRFIIPSSVKTLAWGHRDINKYLTNTLSDHVSENNLDILIRLMEEELCKITSTAT